MSKGSEVVAALSQIVADPPSRESEAKRIAEATATGRMGPSAAAHEILTLVAYERAKVWVEAVNFIVKSAQAAHEDDEGSVKIICDALAVGLREIAARSPQ